MHLLDLEVDELSLRRGTVPVTQRGTCRAPTLSCGEVVVARDRASGEYWSAVVRDVDPGAHQACLRLGLRGRLRPEVALEQVVCFPSARGSDGLRELLTLIGEARTEVGSED